MLPSWSQRRRSYRWRILLQMLVHRARTPPDFRALQWRLFLLSPGPFQIKSSDRPRDIAEFFRRTHRVVTFGLRTIPARLGTWFAEDLFSTIIKSMPNSLSPRWTGFLFLAVTSLGWGVNYGTIKILLREWPPLFSRGISGVAAAILLAGVAAAFGES
jgi:hypothetical protein